MTNPKFVQACGLIREALVEEHRAEGESLQAAGLLDSLTSERLGRPQSATSASQKQTRLDKERRYDHRSATDLSSLHGQKVVDARGTSCPGPILAAKKGMAEVKVGEIMEVLATDSGTQKDLPAWAKKMGHEYLGFVEEPGYLKLFVKRLK